MAILFYNSEDEIRSTFIKLKNAIKERSFKKFVYCLTKLIYHDVLGFHYWRPVVLYCRESAQEKIGKCYFCGLVKTVKYEMGEL